MPDVLRTFLGVRITFQDDVGRAGGGPKIAETSHAFGLAPLIRSRSTLSSGRICAAWGERTPALHPHRDFSWIDNNLCREARTGPMCCL